MKVLKLNHSGEALRIKLRTGGKEHLIPLYEIMYCCADNTYTSFHITNNEKIVVAKPPSLVRKVLLSHGFIDIHRSTIVNPLFIRHITCSEDCKVVLSNNDELEVSRRLRLKLQLELERKEYR